MKTIKYLLTFIFGIALSLSSSMGQIVQGDDGLYYDENDKPYTGIYKEFYEGGTVRTEMVLKEGMKDGYIRIYFPDGKLHEIRSYKHNKMDGKWETRNRKGIKTAEAHYLKGFKDGKWLIWDDKGVLRYDMTYRNGKKTGVWKIYDANGKLVSEKNFDNQEP